MPRQERRAASRRATRDDAPTSSASAGTRAHGEELRAALDDLIDEIDETLEENAEEFLNNYVQRGGE